MASIIRLLKGLWSGSQNDPERDATSVTREGSTLVPSPHAHPTGTPVFTATPELPVSTGTTPSSIRGTVIIHHGATTYTGTVDLFPVGERPSSTLPIDSPPTLPSNDNIARASPRDIRVEPAVEHEDAPELEASSNFPATTATALLNGSSLTQGNGLRSSPQRPLPSASGLSGRQFHYRERGSSSASRTERGSSPPDKLVHVAQLPAAPSSRSVTLDAEPRYKPNPEPQTARVFDSEHWTRQFDSGTNCFSAALVDSPPTPPHTSAVDDREQSTSTAVKRERSPSVVLPTRPPNDFLPSAPQHQVKIEPEMEQIAPRTHGIVQALVTPSKQARGSASGSHASHALMTPPGTTSARRPAVVSSSRYHDSSASGRVQSPSSPPSPCPERSAPASGRTRSTTQSSASNSKNSLQIQAQAAGWDAPSPCRSTRTTSPVRGHASQATASQRQTTTARPFRPPIQEDPTMEWTSIRELVAAPLVNGRRILPRYGPLCLSCGVKLVYKGPTGSGKNEGRPFYKCPTNRHGFGTFADLEGEEDEGGMRCNCPGRPLARRTERNDGGFFWKCLEFRCAWIS